MLPNSYRTGFDSIFYTFHNSNPGVASKRKDRLWRSFLLETYGSFKTLGRNGSALRQGFCSAKTLVRRRSSGSLALAERPGIYPVGQSQRRCTAQRCIFFVSRAAKRRSIPGHSASIKRGGQSQIPQQKRGAVSHNGKANRDPEYCRIQQ